MMMRLIFVQYTILTLAFISIVYLALGLARERDPWGVLALFTSLNILRFGGGLAALAALGRSSMPALLAQVAIGDCVTALLAVTALMLLLRRSRRALLVTGVFNVFGLLSLLVSEARLGYLELVGVIVRRHFLHVPSVGAALYTALHLYSFFLIARARAARRSSAAT